MELTYKQKKYLYIKKWRNEHKEKVKSYNKSHHDKLRTMKHFHCECCNKTFSTSTSLKRHCTSFKHKRAKLEQAQLIEVPERFNNLKL